MPAARLHAVGQVQCEPLLRQSGLLDQQDNFFPTEIPDCSQDSALQTTPQHGTGHAGL